MIKSENLGGKRPRYRRREGWPGCWRTLQGMMMDAVMSKMMMTVITMMINDSVEEHLQSPLL